MYYINYFFIFSILGHFVESHISSNSGILFGYWTPVYGIGSIIILIIYKYVYKMHKNKYLKIFLLFIISAITLSIIEALGGYLINWIFNKELWNYSNFLFNIGKYTALEMALLWGLCSLIFIYFIKIIVDKFALKIPKFMSYMCITIFIIDLIATIIIKTK